MQEQKNVEILGFQDRFAVDFARLNREWLERFNLLEEADAKQLDTPRESIVEPGGEILFALDGECVVGTCAVIRISSTVVELGKLAVDPEARGRGIGRRLTLAAIDLAQSMGAEIIILESNWKLDSAIRLYESLGFRHAPFPENPEYATSDVYMELNLSRHSVEE